MTRTADHEARNQFLRDTLGNNDAARKAAVPTADTVKKVANELGLSLKSEDIKNSDGGRLHFIGDTSAQKVLLYFHGGGFGLSAFEGHIKFLAQCQQKLAAKGISLLVALLEYGLTPAKRYPTQLIQASEGLRLLLAKGYHSSNIVIGGDSAGGNMTLAVASILMKDCDGISPLHVETPLAGLLLISPWASFDSDFTSYERNRNNDIFASDSMHGWARDYITDGQRNNWNEPFKADSTWWKDLPAKSVLNVWGSKEVLQDVDKALGDKLEKAGVNVKNVECEDQVHIDCILDAQTGLGVGPMSTNIWEWLESIL